MMGETWREWLYPLGFLAQIIFSWRFLQQWFVSEREHKSMVTKSFWGISLLGNGLLVLHGLIQLQFHLCLIQLCNGVIAWRNLNLMKNRASMISFPLVGGWMVGLSGCCALLFLLQGHFFEAGRIEWFRLPTWGGTAVRHVGLEWHILGIVGMILFASRFWIQWLIAEVKQKSLLGHSFWWMSLMGALLIIVYASYIADPVLLLGPLFGLVPYTRNLMLLYKV